MPQAIMNQDQTILFNFKWSRWRIQQMRELSAHP